MMLLASGDLSGRSIHAGVQIAHSPAASPFQDTSAGGEKPASTDDAGTRLSTPCHSRNCQCAHLATCFTAAGNCVEVDNNLIPQVLPRPTLHCSSHSQFGFVKVAVLNSLAVMNFSNDECSRTQFQMQVSPTGARFSRHVQRRRLVSNKMCTQFLHSFPVVQARRVESSSQIPIHCDRAARIPPSWDGRTVTKASTPCVLRL